MLIYIYSYILCCCILAHLFGDDFDILIIQTHFLKGSYCSVEVAVGGSGQMFTMVHVNSRDSKSCFRLSAQPYLLHFRSAWLLALQVSKATRAWRALQPPIARTSWSRHWCDQAAPPFLAGIQSIMAKAIINRCRISSAFECIGIWHDILLEDMISYNGDVEYWIFHIIWCNVWGRLFFWIVANNYEESGYKTNPRGDVRSNNEDIMGNLLEIRLDIAWFQYNTHIYIYLSLSLWLTLSRCALARKGGTFVTLLCYLVMFCFRVVLTKKGSVLWCL